MQNYFNTFVSTSSVFFLQMMFHSCDCVIFHCINILYFLYLFTHWWAFSLVLYLVFCEFCSIKMSMLIFWQYAGFNSSDYIPKNVIAASFGSSIISFLRDFHTYFHSYYTNVHFCQRGEGFLSPCSLLSIYYVLCSWF